MLGSSPDARAAKARYERSSTNVGHQGTQAIKRRDLGAEREI